MEIKEFSEEIIEKAYNSKIVRFALLAWVIVVYSVGCSTTSTKAKVTSNLDGSVTQELKQMDITPPFAKKSEAIGKMHTRKSADGTYELETGTSATGIDNTAQGAVVQALVGAILQAYTAGLAVPKAPLKPTALEQILPYVMPRDPNGP